MLVFASPQDFRFQPLPIPIFFLSNVSRLFQSSAKFGRKVTHLTKNFRLIGLLVRHDQTLGDPESKNLALYFDSKTWWESTHYRVPQKLATLRAIFRSHLISFVFGSLLSSCIFMSTYSWSIVVSVECLNCPKVPIAVFRFGRQCRTAKSGVRPSWVQRLQCHLISTL
jgi:hypothetical protein